MQEQEKERSRDRFKVKSGSVEKASLGDSSEHCRVLDDSKKCR